MKLQIRILKRQRTELEAIEDQMSYYEVIMGTARLLCDAGAAASASISLLSYDSTKIISVLIK